MSTIIALKCKECGFTNVISNFPYVMYYDTDEDGNIMKDSVPICPHCDAEGDDYFEQITEEDL